MANQIRWNRHIVPITDQRFPKRMSICEPLHSRCSQYKQMKCYKDSINNILTSVIIKIFDEKKLQLGSAWRKTFITKHAFFEQRRKIHERVKRQLMNETTSYRFKNLLVGIIFVTVFLSLKLNASIIRILMRYVT